MAQTVIYQPLPVTVVPPGRAVRVMPNGDIHILPAPATQIASLTVGVLTVTASYAVGPDDLVVLANAGSGALTITLPPVQGNAGREIRVKKIDASTNVVTIAAQGTSRIDGAASTSLSTQYARATLVCDGANWNLF